MGGLERLIADDGPTGVTGNPETLDRLISVGRDYDDVLDELAQIDSHIGAQAIYERIAVADARMAADALRTVFDRTHGLDGFASIGMSPYLAHDTEASIAEARRLCERVHRPNLMIKVPAIREGIDAIEALIAEGINVNVTLVYSLAQYEAVVGAYLRALNAHPIPGALRLLSPFLLAESIPRLTVNYCASAHRRHSPCVERSPSQTRSASSAGSADIFHSDRFASLRLRGVHPQRMLWVSCHDRESRRFRGPLP